MSRPSQVWKDPDFHRNRYGGLLTVAGMDPAVLNDDVVLERVYNAMNGVDDSLYSEMMNAGVTGIPKHMPDAGRAFLQDAVSPTQESANASRFDAGVLGAPGEIPNLTPTAAGLSTAAPGIPSAAEQLGNATAEVAGIHAGPALIDAATSAASLVDNPTGAGPRQTTLQTGPRLQQGTVGAPRRRGPVLGRGAAPAAAAVADAVPDTSIAAEVAKRSGNRFGYVSPDLGTGKLIDQGTRSLTGAMPAGAGRNIVSGAGRLLGIGARALPFVGAALPVVTSAMEGNEAAGAGGAIIQSGSALAGAGIGAAIGSVVPGLGTVIGAGIGGMIGGSVGSGLTGAAVGAVNRAQGGDTGLSGSIGAALDPLIDTQTEKDSMATVQQMNSPAMQAIRQEEALRKEKERTQLTHNLVMQTLANGIS